MRARFDLSRDRQQAFEELAELAVSEQYWFVCVSLLSLIAIFLLSYFPSQFTPNGRPCEVVGKAR
jgi:hypothetical protein